MKARLDVFDHVFPRHSGFVTSAVLHSFYYNGIFIEFSKDYNAVSWLRQAGHPPNAMSSRIAEANDST